MTAAEAASSGRSGLPPGDSANNRSRSSFRRSLSRSCSRRTVLSLRLGARLAMRLPSDCIQQIAQSADDDIDRLSIFAALWHDQVGVLLTRCDVQVVHRPDRAVVLLLDRTEVPAAIHHIATDAAQQPDVVVRIDEQPQVETVSQFRYGEKQNTFDHDYVAGRHGDGFGPTGVGGEVVLWAFHTTALAQLVQVAGE